MKLIPIGERSNIYPDIVYTPVDVSKFTSDVNTETTNPLE